METIYYDELDELFSELSIGDELVILRDQGGNVAKNFGKVKSITDQNVKVTLRDGNVYTILIDAYDESSKKFKMIDTKENKTVYLSSFKEIYAVIKIRDHNTGKITKKLGKFNPSETRNRVIQTQQQQNSKRANYEDYLGLQPGDKYSGEQIKILNELFDELKNTIDNIEDGDRVYIYQAPMGDYVSALTYYWEDWVDEYGDDEDSIAEGDEGAPDLDHMYVQDDVNRISFVAEVDNAGKIYAKKPIEKTNKLQEVPGYLKTGHYFTSDNLVFDDGDYKKNIALYGDYSLEVESIFDIKIAKGDEPDPDDNDYEEEEGEDGINVDSNGKMSDADIMKMIANDKDVVNFLSRKPNFWDFIKNGGKRRKTKPFTRNHFYMIKKAINQASAESNGKKIDSGKITDVDTSIKWNNGKEVSIDDSLTLKVNLGPKKLVIYAYDD